MPSEPQTESGRARPLSADEENAIRDFYARRTTRLAMGPSESIPRLLATLDRTRTASANIAALGVAASEEAASKAVAEDAANKAGHRTNDPHDCFTMRCHDLASDLEAAREAASKAVAEVLDRLEERAREWFGAGPSYVGDIRALIASER